MSDTVLLADGTVLISGGAGWGAADHSHDPVLDCEIFDPTTETFRTDAQINRQRMYHASAVLLPSGRVALAGNTEHWNPGNPVEDTTVEVYTPDYLLRGPQPRLTAAPAGVAYGDVADLQTPDAARIDRVALVRCSTVTHSSNMDQRWIGLLIEARLADRLRVRIPFERPLCPPGRYMFFLLDTNGVPSVALPTLVDPRLRPNTRVLVHNTWITVRESDATVDTGIDLHPGDEFELEANGEIWAGVILTGRDGPEGWNNVDHDPKFPLHTGSNARPFSLIGRFARSDWFYVGAHLGPQPYDEAAPKRLFLRTNDDTPGNGNGQFNCLVRVWRDQPSGRIVIAGVVPNPPGSDVAVGGGEYVTLRNEGTLAVDLGGWWLSDLAGHRLVITRPTRLQPGGVIRVHTGPGTDNAGDYFAGRRSAIWNNSGDTITLWSADGRVVARLSY
jgi:hypothetical protein